MTVVVMLVLMFAAAYLQTMLPGFVFLGEAHFPFLLAVVIYYALARNTDLMLAASFMGGFLQDGLSPIPLGYSIFAFGVIGFVVSRFRNLVMFDAPVAQAFFGGSAAAASTLILYVLLAREGLVDLRTGQVLLKLIGHALLGIVATPVAFSAGGALDRLVGNVKRNKNVVEVKWSV